MTGQRRPVSIRKWQPLALRAIRIPPWHPARGEDFLVNGVIGIAEQRAQALPSYSDIRDTDQLPCAVEMNLSCLWICGYTPASRSKRDFAPQGVASPRNQLEISREK